MTEEKKALLENAYASWLKINLMLLLMPYSINEGRVTTIKVAKRFNSSFFFTTAWVYKSVRREIIKLFKFWMSTIAAYQWLNLSVKTCDNQTEKQKEVDSWCLAIPFALNSPPLPTFYRIRNFHGHSRLMWMKWKHLMKYDKSDS